MYGTWYTQAAFHASHLGVTDILYDKEKMRVSRIQSVLNKAGSKIKKDPDAEEVFKKWRNQLKSFKTEVIAEIKGPLKSWGKAGRDSGTAAAMAEAIRVSANADFAIHGKFTSADIPSKVTANALFKVIP